MITKEMFRTCNDVIYINLNDFICTRDYDRKIISRYHIALILHNWE